MDIVKFNRLLMNVDEQEFLTKEQKCKFRVSNVNEEFTIITTKNGSEIYLSNNDLLTCFNMPVHTLTAIKDIFKFNSSYAYPIIQKLLHYK